MNKSKVLEIYQTLAEKAYPGKGVQGRSIVEKYWDKDADNFVDQGRLDSMGYTVDDVLTVNAARGIAQRNPAMAAELLKLKG